MSKDNVSKLLERFGFEMPRTQDEAEELVYFLCGKIESLEDELRQYDQSRKELRVDMEDLRKKFILTRAYLPIHHRGWIEDEVEETIEMFP